MLPRFTRPSGVLSWGDVIPSLTFPTGRADSVMHVLSQDTPPLSPPPPTVTSHPFFLRRSCWWTDPFWPLSLTWEGGLARPEVVLYLVVKWVRPVCSPSRGFFLLPGNLGVLVVSMCDSGKSCFRVNTQQRMFTDPGEWGAYAPRDKQRVEVRGAGDHPSVVMQDRRVRGPRSSLGDSMACALPNLLGGKISC